MYLSHIMSVLRKLGLKFSKALANQSNDEKPLSAILLYYEYITPYFNIF